MSPESRVPQEIFSQRTAQSILLGTTFVERSLEHDRWATPLTLAEAETHIEERVTPLLDNLKDALTPFMTRPLSYAGALNRALDAQTRAVRTMGIEEEFKNERWEIGNRIVPSIKYALASAYRGEPATNGTKRYLPPEVFKTLKQMVEVTERGLLWDLTAKSPLLAGLPNPFLPFVRLYQQGVVKIKFEHTQNADLMRIHVPVKGPFQPTMLGCWDDETNSIDRLHKWESPCTACNTSKGV